MSDKKSPGSLLLDIETWLNKILQSLFPTWYCIRYLSEIRIEEVGNINPRGYLSHRWLSVYAACHAAADSLEKTETGWQECADVLRKIPTVRHHHRFLSVHNLLAVEFSEEEKEYLNILEYGAHHCQNIPHASAEEFDHLVSKVFHKPSDVHQVVYREIDGRYYYKNQEDPAYLAALLMHCRDKGRDLNIRADISIEGIDQRALSLMRSRYWFLIVKRDVSYRLAYLIRAAKVPCEIADFEWRRSDLAFLVMKKAHYRSAQIVEALVNYHYPRSVIEWGRYLQSHHHPFRNR